MRCVLFGKASNLCLLKGRKRFYHRRSPMLTTEAWNALLKTIEEPLAHVMPFILTTEIEKLPVTIVSRCQRYAP